MRKSTVFISAICKANEVSLLTAEQIVRLSNAGFDDAIKILHERGYNEGIYTDDSIDIDRFIVRQYDLLVDFIREYAPNDVVENFLLASMLSNNIKSAYKVKRGGIKTLTYSAFDCLAVESGEYSDIPKEFACVLRDLDEKNAGAREIDIAITKAMFAYKRRLARNNKLLNHLLTIEIDSANIMTFVRAQKLGLDEADIKALFIEGGSLPFGQSVLAGTEYEDIKTQNAVEMETQFDNYALRIADKDALEVESIAPIVSYFMRKSAELKTVKMILVCIKSDARNEIKKRIRGLYD